MFYKNVVIVFKWRCVNLFLFYTNFIYLIDFRYRKPLFAAEIFYSRVLFILFRTLDSHFRSLFRSRIEFLSEKARLVSKSKISQFSHL